MVKNPFIADFILRVYNTPLSFKYIYFIAFSFAIIPTFLEIASEAVGVERLGPLMPNTPPQALYKTSPFKVDNVTKVLFKPIYIFTTPILLEGNGKEIFFLVFANFFPFICFLFFLIFHFLKNFL
jgi:hypothetical protein